MSIDSLIHTQYNVNISKQKIKHFKLTKVLTDTLAELNATPEWIETYETEKVSFGCIKDAENNVLAYGSANGKLHKVKCIAECIEHYFYAQKVIAADASLSDICTQVEFQKDTLVTKFKKYLNTKSQNVHTVEFKNLTTNQSVLIPHVWCSSKASQPELNFFKSLHSSSGFSFGLNLNMARTHSILELIERHLVSSLLYSIDHNLESNAEKIELVGHQSLISKIQSLEDLHDGKILCLNLPSSLSVFTTFMVFFPNNTVKFPLPQTASKCGFSLLESLEGTLNEMVQILTLYSSEEREEDLFINSKWERRAKFSESLSLEKLKTQNLSSVNLHYTQAKPQFRTQLSSKLKNNFRLITSKDSKLLNLIQELNKLNYYPCERIVRGFKNGTVVIQIFIPGFEKYNLVRLGCNTPTHGNFGL